MGNLEQRGMYNEISGKLLSYPKVWALGHPKVAEVFQDPVEVQEKLDGSQFSFAEFSGGRLWIRSKNAVIDPNNPPEMFAKAVATICKASEDKNLMPDVIYRAEAFRGPHHNHLTYDRVPEGNMALFDVMTGIETYCSYEMMKSLALKMGIEATRSFGIRTITALSDIEYLLKEISILGGPQIEGLVFKSFTLFTDTGKPMFAKLVRPEFKERQRVSWKTANPGPVDIINKIADTFSTEPRWRKSVQHLNESGKLEHAPKDIGILIKTLTNDVKEECEEEIKTALFNWAWGKIKRRITRNVPEWYKELLLKQQFERKEE